MSEAQAYRVLFVGDDKSYWNELTEYWVRKYGDSDFEFLFLNTSQYSDRSEFIYDVLAQRSQAIFIDFTANDDMWSIWMMLRLFNINRYSLCTGIVTEKSRKRLLGSGFDFIGVKGVEYNALIYPIVNLLKYDGTLSTGYAKAKFGVPLQASGHASCRVLFYTNEYVRVETGVKLEDEKQVKMFFPSLDKKLSSHLVRIRELKRSYHFYNMKYVYDLFYEYADPPFTGDIDSDERFNNCDTLEDINGLKEMIKKERADLLVEYTQKKEISYKKVDQWIDERRMESSSYRTQVCVVSEQRVFKSEELEKIVKNKSQINILSSINSVVMEDGVARPDIICFEMSHDTEDPNSIATNWSDLHNYVKKFAFDITKPFLVLFNCKEEVPEDIYYEFKSYANFLIYDKSVSWSVIQKLQSIVETKKQKVIESEAAQKFNDYTMFEINPKPNVTKENFLEKRYYPKKYSDDSYAELYFDATILELNEGEAIIMSTLDLMDSFCLVQTPKLFGFAVLQSREIKKKNVSFYEHNVVLNYVAEAEVMQIRQLAQSGFFEKINEQRHKELEDFKKMNQKALERRQQEEADKIEKELETESTDS